MRVLLILLFSLLPMPSKASSVAPPMYESVLFIGDDHVAGAFGNAVDAYLRTISIEVNTIAECGSTPANWIGVRTEFQSSVCGFWQRDEKRRERKSKEFKSRSFSEELAKSDPDLTIIALGTYMLKNERDMQNEQSSIEKMVSEIERIQSRCVWIGPPQLSKEPYASNLDSGVRTLKKILSKLHCDFIDSSKLTRYKGKDGLEYQVAAATSWGAKISRELDKLGRPSPQEEQSLNLEPAFVNPSSPSGTAPR
ncbi:hypothetical protein [Bdellovibrio sp. KM01]|uniref:hypothetical protein n=1 Tax=Bdellovibrio sp. KM01 TaxID=2748865 RepID=UPI0015E982CF|nr:hypothetical protein [Bdellovibrio sp. KM01]QLY26836.1 hypothetical protein HW988_07520 [Bdellovibrio sp. KM01]